MVTKELVSFITEELNIGKSEAEIRTILQSEGWKEPDILLGFEQVKKQFSLSNIFQSLPRKHFFILVAGILLLFGMVTVSVLGATSPRVVSQNKNLSSITNTVSPIPSIPTVFPTITVAPTVVSSPTISTNNNQITANCGVENYVIDASGKSPGPHPAIGCFITSAKVCNTAQLTLQNSLDAYGMKTSSTISYEIAKAPNGCQLTLHQGKISYVLPAGMTEEMLGPVINTVKQLENTQGVCLFANNNDLAAVFEKLDSGDLGTTGQSTIYVNGSCSGTYFDAVNSSTKVVSP